MRALGHNPSPVGYAGTHGAFAADHVSPVGAVRVDMDGARVWLQRDLDLPILNQGGFLGSCEWMSATAAAAMVTDDELRSALAGYLESLFLDGAYLPTNRLDNRGTNGATVHQILTDVGVCSESEWPYNDDSDTWDTRPGIKAMQSGWRSRKVGTHRIVSLGSERGADVRASIDAGRPVQIGGPCSQAYLDYAGEDRAWSRFDPSIGGHAQLVVAYWWRGDDCQYAVRNSWGESWGNGGRSWYSLAGLNEQDELYAFFPRSAS